MDLDAEELGNLLSAHAESCEVAGAAVAVFRDGMAASACAGLADVEADIHVTHSTQFQAGSLSKSMVATVVARLVGQNRFGFDDPIGSLVPELASADWGARVTVRHLLANTVVLPGVVADDLASIDEDAEDCFAAFCELLASRPLRSGPGEELWSYQPGVWRLLARLIEVVTSSPWTNAMRAELFEPLGMRSTDWSAQLDPSTMASHYVIEEGGRCRRDPDPAFFRRFMGPPAGIGCTINDLLAFGRSHVDENVGYADPSVLAAMRERHATAAIPTYLDGWCLGWAILDWKGGPVWGWEGILSGHRAVLRLLPEHQGAVALLSNTSSGRALYRSLFPVLLERYFEVEMPSLAVSIAAMSPDDLSRYTGTFGWPQMSVVVESRSDHLEIQMPEGLVTAYPFGEGWFLKDPDDPDYGEAFTFRDFDSGGRPALLYYFLTALPRMNDRGPR